MRITGRDGQGIASRPHLALQGIRCSLAVSAPCSSVLRASIVLAAASACSLPQRADAPAAPAAAGELDRTVLPIHEPSHAPIDARDAQVPPRFEVSAPASVPNVVIVLIDDIGFGHGSAFGGPIQMPTLERLAADGLRYNRFHTTALCSPTRTALLTGHSHHANNTGAIMELATAFPGNTGVRPRSITTLAEILRQNGYGAAAFGEYHETPPWEVSISGPFERWPTGPGFEKFYGFIGGETNQWAPAIFDGTTRVELLATQETQHGFHLASCGVPATIRTLGASIHVCCFPRSPPCRTSPSTRAVSNEIVGRERAHERRRAGRARGGAARGRTRVRA